MIEILNEFERHLIRDGKRHKTVDNYVGDEHLSNYTSLQLHNCSHNYRLF
ncbi:hypothetical protein IMX26_03625 [Clostridium sp. 'deep sea']|nr:hypothetical protein [Clostridium sp. 'deep sea']QOR35920.1 hypothetical protein IMX26_03625 [Clostridium sp. 'deep sea']